MNSFVQRLHEILSSRYGCQMNIRSLQIVDDSTPLTEPTVILAKLHIPILGKYQELLATAIVSNIEKLSDQQKVDITNLVRMVLEPYLLKKKNDLN